MTGRDASALQFVFDVRGCVRGFARAMAVVGREVRHANRNVGRSRHHQYERPDRARINAAYRHRQTSRRRRNRR